MATSRADGRRFDELRPVVITPDYVRTAAGAVLMEMGDTRVICTVSVEDRVPPFLVGSGRGWLTAEYGMLPGSSGSRIPRESTTGKVNGRTREIQRLIGRSLRSTLDLTLVGERTLHVDCDVIQADGGTRTASITGAYVALGQAVDRLLEDEVLGASPLIGRAAAISIGLVDDCALLDLDYGEDSRAQADMNLVMDGEKGILEIQGTAEGRPYSRQEADRMIDLGTAGIEQLLQLQQQAVNSDRADHS